MSKGGGLLFWGKLGYFKLILEVGKISEKFCCIHFLTNICNNYKFIILLKIAKRKLEFFFFFVFRDERVRINNIIKKGK